MSTIEGFATAWGLQDIEAALAYMADDAVYVLHSDSSVTGFGGEYRGKDEIRLLFTQVREDWQVLDHESGPWRERNRGFSGRVIYHLRHRGSGQEIVDARRFFFQVGASGIERCEETQDVERMRAFLGFVSWHGRERVS